MPTTHPDPDKPHLLLADDCVEEQRHLLDLLRPHYRITVAFDGQQAYQRALSIRPDLILLDVDMPRMDGFSTCRLLKANAITQAIPVIFLSSMNAAVERIQGLSLGGVDYVSKPFSAEEVLVRIRIHLDLAGGKASLPPSTAPAPAPSNPEEVTLIAAKRLLGKDLETPPSLSELARALGLHEKKLSRIFRDHTGMTVFAFIREERMRRAEELLTETDLSIQDIATQMGFQTPANFATAFRERTGATPRDYRQAKRLPPTSSTPSPC